MEALVNPHWSSLSTKGPCSWVLGAWSLPCPVQPLHAWPAKLSQYHGPQAAAPPASSWSLAVLRLPKANAILPGGGEQAGDVLQALKGRPRSPREQAAGYTESVTCLTVGTLQPYTCFLGYSEQPETKTQSNPHTYIDCTETGSVASFSVNAGSWGRVA